MRVLLAGGGTAGHINPALAIADYIKSQEKCEFLFVGTGEGIETELVPRYGYRLRLIRIHGFERKINVQNFKNIFEILWCVSESKKIIRDFKPDVVIGTGGYVAGPVLYAAAKMRIPTLIHESNAYPGVTTKILSGYVDTVALGSAAAEKHLKKYKRIINTGNPVRPEILSTDENHARQKLGLCDRPFILSFGGSLGARDFNKAVVDWISKVGDKKQYDILMGTGKLNQYEAVLNRFDENGFDLEKNKDSVKVSEYIYNMDVCMSAADIVISRAGASTLSELTALGRAAILVPSPYVTANHQEHNARELERMGAAKVVLEKDLNADTLNAAVESLTRDKKKLDDMKKASKAMGKTDATDVIYREIKKLMN